MPAAGSQGILAGSLNPGNQALPLTKGVTWPQYFRQPQALLRRVGTVIGDGGV